MSMHVIRCGDCAFFEDKECHRYPPVVTEEVPYHLASKPRTSFPKVDKDDWCGEFKRSM